MIRQIQEKQLYHYNQNTLIQRNSSSDSQSSNSCKSDSDHSEQQIIVTGKYKTKTNNKDQPYAPTQIQNQRHFVVQGHSNFDITDYFKFQQKDDGNRQKTFFKYLSQKHYLAWIILFYSVCSSAMIPPWLMSIPANKILRISWRCLLHLCILFPFILFEYRTADTKKRQMYTIKHIFYPKHFRKLCIAAFQATFFASFILSAIEWTYISHCFVLASLPNFFLSIQRTIKGNNGPMQRSGQIIIVFGILLVIYDSYALIAQNATEKQRNVYNNLYLTRQWWQRILGDLTALFVACVTSQLSKKTLDIKQYYPPYLAMSLNNIMVFIFTAASAYFFNGASFDLNHKFGIFGIFTHQHFINFLYMSIVLGMGVFISLVMISKMFVDPIIPAIAMTLEPIISTVLWHIVGVQKMPGACACIGFILIVPGLMAILVGHAFFTRTHPPITQMPVLSKKITQAQYNQRNSTIRMLQMQTFKNQQDEIGEEDKKNIP